MTTQTPFCPESRDPSTFPPLSPGYFSTKLSKNIWAETVEPFRIGYFSLMDGTTWKGTPSAIEQLGGEKSE